MAMKRDLLTESNQSAIIQLCHSALDSRTLRVELLRRLRTIIPFNYAYFSTTDPATQFSTSSVLVEEPPAWCMSVFLENEFLQDDFNKFSDMLRNHQAVAVLSEATGHDMLRSQRYQDMLVPLSMDDELRAIFVTDAACWGTLCLHREKASSRYTTAEATYLAQLAPHIAAGLRKVLLLGSAPAAKTPDGPGVLILTDDLAVVAMTAATEYWLAELIETEGGDRYALPRPVHTVITALRALERGMVTPDYPPKIRLRTGSGHWLVLYASRLISTAGEGQISVIFELAQPAEISPLIMLAYDLTKREGEITQCVLLGLSTTAIAERLHISQNTVQDHLKAIFTKVGVGSRGELTGRIFARHYQPNLSSYISR
ncbi:MAG: helix-turn-helix transcriptional regulator [Anaerolineae bacterium]|nr:helix-turn-helix transcriptional regulator [Anaerolineae bacterium]